MQAILNKRHRNSIRGFTIVELLVVMVVSGILIGMVFTSLASYYQAAVTSSARTVNTTDNRVSLRAIQNNLTDITSFLSTSTLSARAPLGANNTASPWTYNGASPEERVLIAKSNAKDKPSTDIDRMIVFKPIGGNCGLAAAVPLEVNTIYYVAADPQATTQRNLYRRTVVENTPPCPHPITGATSTPFQKTTCASGVVNSLCAGSDGLILKNIKSFSVDYYMSANDQTPVPGIYLTPTNPLTQSTVDNAAAIQVNVTTENRVEQGSEEVKSTIRISRTN